MMFAKIWVEDLDEEDLQIDYHYPASKKKSHYGI